MLKVFLLCIAVSVFFSGGLDWRLISDGPEASENNGYGYGYSEGYYKKIDNPWLDLAKLYKTGSHDAKLNLRLTVPVILHYLGLRAHWVLPLLTIGAICAILFLSCLITFRLTGDRVTSLFLSLGVAATYTGSFAMISYYDAIAIAQLALAMLPGLRPWLKGLLVFTASFTDERAFVASAFLLVPSLSLPNPGGAHARSRFLQPDFLAILGGMAAWCLGRILLMRCAGLYTPATGVSFYLFLVQIKFMHVGIWFALEGGWLLVGLAIFMLWHRRQWLALGSLVMITTALLTGSFMVADVLRSAAYLFPVLYVSLLIIAKGEPTASLRSYCFLAFLISLAGGNYNIFADRIIWFEPLSINIFETLCRLAFDCC